MRSRWQAGALFLIAVLAAASMWFYVDRILVAYQVQDAAAHQRPRGNLSDLYPRWLGARELLLHQRNPYGDDVALEIQKGYYGRVLDPANPNDPKDQQGFAYPVYVVFLLAPLIGFSFHGVQIWFHWLLLGLTAASVWWWLRALCWRWPFVEVATCAALMLGSVPAVQGIKLQQLTLLIAALMAGSVACIASGFFFCGGLLLALATIKPQLAWPLAGWLLLWTVSDWRTRRRFVAGFAFMMGLLLAGAELVLPGWLAMFAEAIRKYHRYTQNQSVLDQLVPWMYSGRVLAALAVLASVFFLWKLRRETVATDGFARALALVTALTVLIVPMFAPYNQVVLLPAVLLLVRDRSLFTARSRALRFAYRAGACALCWQWLASLSLSAGYFLLSPASVLSGWKLPFLATFALPVLVFILIVLDVRATTLNRPALSGDRCTT